MSKVNEIRQELESAFYDRTFRRETGMDRREMEMYLNQSRFRTLPGRLQAAQRENGRFDSRIVLDIARQHFPCLMKEPKEGWLRYCYNHVLHELYPNLGADDLSPDAALGRCFLMQLLRGLYSWEQNHLPFDPTYTMQLLSSNDVQENGFTHEYLKFRRLIRRHYVYEFMRIGTDITPFNTLGHISGVHYVAMFAARQLRKAGVPVDLAIVSGAAAGHDIGKYGCRKSEERRIPYLHYYYTDRCYDRFGLPTIGHIAANHSTWDLELENLSAESLLLIYADFRVKSTRDESGAEIIHFYTLGEAFSVILNKLDNVDEAKRQRYQKVYDKLVDFEEFMKEQGVITDIPENYPTEPEDPPEPSIREKILLEGNDIIDQLKYTAIDHNIRLMSHFHSDSDFAGLIEHARSEQNWKNIRTYVSIFGEYSTYMTEKQKLMTIRFLYDLLAHREGDIRSQAASILGEIIGTFNEEYKKELPEGETLPDKSVTNLTLFDSYLGKIIHPDHKLTEQHRKWIETSLNSFIEAVLEHCNEDCRHNYMDILLRCYTQTDCNDAVCLILLKAMMAIRPEYCSEADATILRAFLQSALNGRSLSLKTAAVLAGSHLFPEYQNEHTLQYFKDILEIPEDPAAFTEKLNNMFLDDLKANTPWVVKAANIHLMTDYVSHPGCQSELLHVATHLSNLIKVSETVTVRRTAGEGILKIVDLMSPEQRNELAVELYNGLEIGDYQFSKYIPDYLGIILLKLNPNELDEFIGSMSSILGTGNDKLTSSMLNTVGIMLEHYDGYEQLFPENPEDLEHRKLRLLYILIKGYAYYDKLISQEAFWVMGTRFFGSRRMSLRQKDELFFHCYKKLLSLMLEKTEDSLEFYNNAAVLNHLYRYISQHRSEIGPFNFPVNNKVAFYPGTFDPFSLGHKAVAQTIRDMGFDVYLALDEFSWSKNTQPRLQRRKIMTMSAADEESLFPFPDDFSVNIANDEDVKKLKEAFAGKELYIAVGSDVVKNASCYRNTPSEDSIHTVNHIIFARASNDPQDRNPEKEHRYPITGNVINLTLKKYYEDISSTRIRENIDKSRDISNLIDPVAQSYIYDRNLYLREPAYKHILQAREISISTFKHHTLGDLDDLGEELGNQGYDLGKISSYLQDPNVYGVHIKTLSSRKKIASFAAAHQLETSSLLEEFGNLETASHIREHAGGKIAVIGFFYYGKTHSISNLGQITITEILAELIARDFAYAVYHPADPNGMNPRILEALKRQGFVNIAEGKNAEPIYAVDMRSPIVIFRDVETMIKAPLNKNPKVLRAIEDAHNNLLRTMTTLYPSQLILSFNTSAVHNKIISKVAEINGVPPVNDPKKIRGPYMSVPFGKSLADVLVPNTVTNPLHTEKYFDSDLRHFTVRESKHYSPLEYQAKTIRSFNRPVILIDDLLHKGHRMRIIDPILRKNNVEVKEIMVGVMTGNARDAMTMSGRKAESAYFLPTLKVWLNERDCYPLIGGDSITNDNPDETDRNAAINLIMPYTTPRFIGKDDTDKYSTRCYQYSMTCLENARNIWQTIEEEYQAKFERKLTLKRIGEVITYRRVPDLGNGITLDENMAPTACVDNVIQRLIRLNWGQNWQ